MKVKPSVLSDDKKELEKSLGHRWKEGRERDRPDERNRDYLKRPRRLTKFVMDEIRREGDNLKAEFLRRFDGSERGVSLRDEHLVAPYEDFREKAKRYASSEVLNCRIFEEHRKLIVEHVESVRSNHRKWVTKDFTRKPITERQDILRQLSRDFVSRLDPALVDSISEDELDRIRASYAYICDHKSTQSGGTRFPWDVAMRELCCE